MCGRPQELCFQVTNKDKIVLDSIFQPFYIAPIVSSD